MTLRLLSVLFVSLALIALPLLSAEFLESGHRTGTLGAFLTERLTDAGLLRAVAAVLPGIVGLVLLHRTLVASPRHRAMAGLALHPAALLLGVCGHGLSAAAFLLFFVSLQQLEREGRPKDVPFVGFALFLAALCVEGFGAVFLAAASPLFLIAPKPMLERHMASFYLVALLPGLCLLAARALLVPAPLTHEPEALRLMAGFPPALAVPLLGVLFASLHRWRLALVGLTLLVGLLVSDGPGPLLTTLLVLLGAAFLLRAAEARALEAGLAVMTVLVAAAL